MRKQARPKGEDAQAGSTKGRGCASRLDQRERMRKQARPKGEEIVIQASFYNASRAQEGRMERREGGKTYL